MIACKWKVEIVRTADPAQHAVNLEERLNVLARAGWDIWAVQTMVVDRGLVWGIVVACQSLRGDAPRVA